MKIAVDMDDVVCAFVDQLCKCLRMEYDVDLTPDKHILEWDLSSVLDPIVGHNWWDWWAERDWLWAQAEAVPGAIGSLRTLRREGHYLQLVTSKPQWAEAQTWRWLGKWRPPVHEVIIIPFVAGAPMGKETKTDATLLIDDKPENCFEWAADAPWRRAILFSRPHNRLVEVDGTGSGQVKRADDWHGTMKLIEGGLW